MNTAIFDALFDDAQPGPIGTKTPGKSEFDRGWADFKERMNRNTYALVRGPRWLRNPGICPAACAANDPLGGHRNRPVRRPGRVEPDRYGIWHPACAYNPGIPYVVIIVGATLMGLNRRLELASMSLGASHPRTAMRIVLPLIMPGLIAGGIFAFISSFDEVVVTSFIASLRIETLPLKIWEGIRYAIDPTVAAISAMLITIPVIALPFVRRRGGPIP